MWLVSEWSSDNEVCASNSFVLEDISLEQVPDQIKKYMETTYKALEKYITDMKISIDTDWEKVYMFRYFKSIWIIQENSDWNIIGSSLFYTWNHRSEDHKKNPYVQYTETLELYKKNGYWAKRLLLMKDLSQTLCDTMLNSWRDFHDDSAESIRKRYVEKWKAETYQDILPNWNVVIRYRFI